MTLVSEEGDSDFGMIEVKVCNVGTLQKPGDMSILVPHRLSVILFHGEGYLVTATS